MYKGIDRTANAVAEDGVAEIGRAVAVIGQFADPPHLLELERHVGRLRWAVVPFESIGAREPHSHVNSPGDRPNPRMAQPRPTATSMIGEEVRAFLRDYIDSYEGLEVLLLLRRDPTSWTSEALCTRLNANAMLIERTLVSLVRAGLVSVSSESTPSSYAYDRENEARDAIVCALARAYREEPIQIIQLMSTNAIERLRTGAMRAFADAFILRKDKDRG